MRIVIHIAFDFVAIVLSFLAGCKYKEVCYYELAIATAKLKAEYAQLIEAAKAKL